MIMARKAAEYMLKHRNSKIIVVSLTEDQAELIIVFTLNYLEKNYKKMIAKKAKKPTKRKITLINGSYILARPVGNTGDAVRGFTGDILIVDEASRMPELMWAAAKPTLATTGGKIWMCSTPFGKQGYFYKCYLNADERFKVFHINTPQVYAEREWPNEQIKKEALQFLEDERRDMSALEFAQEYEGRFVDDLQQFFKDELVLARMQGKRPGIVSKGRIYSLGVDIARMGEDTGTYEVLMLTKTKHLIQVENQSSRKQPLTQTAEHIIGLNSLYDFNKIYVDDEGIGIGVFDILMNDDRTRRKTEALRNSQKVIDRKGRKKRMLKEDLYLNLLRLMELNRITLLDDPEIFQSFKSVQFEYTTDKKGKPFMRIFGNNTHIVEGLIRAAWIEKRKSLNPYIDYV